LIQFSSVQSVYFCIDQAQNTLSGIQGQEATAVAVIYVTAPTFTSMPPDGRSCHLGH